MPVDNSGTQLSVEHRLAAIERDVSHLKREMNEARADSLLARMLANDACRDAAATKPQGIVVTHEELKNVASLLESFAERRDQADAERLKQAGL